MLNTIFRNLISNAIKFTPEKGEVKINFEDRGGWVEVKITDTGIGMSEQTRKKLFRIEDYHSSPGTGGETGTGLGLIICKEFIEKIGGTISVESQLGIGTTFSFSLPRSD